MGPGQHNIQIIGYIVFAVSALGYLIFRGLVLLRTRELLMKAGISFIPQSSVASLQFRILTRSHKQEIMTLLQKTPVSYAIKTAHVPAHVETVKSLIHGDELKVELEVSGKGECFALIGLTARDLEECAYRHDYGSLLKQRAASYSSVASFTDSGSVSLSIPIGMETYGPITICLTGDNCVEFTVASASAQIHQFISIQPHPGLIHIVPIFSQNIDECMVCYDANSNTVVLDCRHCCMCTGCIRHLRDNRCIVCRQNFHQYLYLPRPGDATPRINF